MSTVLHVIAENTTCLGQTFIRCSCGVEVSGGQYGDTAQSNFDHHLSAVATDRASAGPTIRQLVAAVQEHAQEHYHEGGWDVVIEAYDDLELADLITRGGATTYTTAIEYVEQIVEVAAEIRLDRCPMPGWDY